MRGRNTRQYITSLLREYLASRPDPDAIILLEERLYDLVLMSEETGPVLLEIAADNSEYESLRVGALGFLSFILEHTSVGANWARWTSSLTRIVLETDSDGVAEKALDTLAMGRLLPAPISSVMHAVFNQFVEEHPRRRVRSHAKRWLRKWGSK